MVKLASTSFVFCHHKCCNQRIRMPGGPVQILEPRENGKYALTEEFYKVFQKIQDHELSVVSILGPMREGKSFFMSFLVQYMESDQTGDWLRRYYQKHETPSCFHWKGQESSVTKGIWMWSEPFTVKRNGKPPLSVILMDVEGNYDPTANDPMCSTIVTLSLVMSSVLLYNVKRRINTLVVDQFQYFAEFGRLSAQTRGQGKPFQEMYFLVRDWPHEEEYKYGVEGGEVYLQRKIGEIAAQHPQNASTINNAFTKSSCCLMPIPSTDIFREKRFEYKDTVLHLDEEFIQQMQVFANHLLDKDNIVPKAGLGSVQTVRQYIETVESVVGLWNGNDVPRMSMVTDMMMLQKNSVICKEAVNKYDKEMRLVVGTRVSERNLRADHIAACEVAREHFQNNACKQNEAAYQKQLDELNDSLEIEYEKRKQDINYKLNDFEYWTRVLGNLAGIISPVLNAGMNVANTASNIKHNHQMMKLNK